MHGLYGALVRITARLGDILSQLYLCSAVFKRFIDDGQPGMICHWFCGLYKIACIRHNKRVMTLRITYQGRFDLVLKRLFFPFGDVQTVIPDQQVRCFCSVQAIRAPAWVSSAGNPLRTIPWVLGKAFQDVLAAEPIFAKIKQHLDQPIVLAQLDEIAEVALKNKSLMKMKLRFCALQKKADYALFRWTIFCTADLSVKSVA